MKYPLRFDDLESALLKQNRFLKAHAMLVSLVMGLLCMFALGKQSYFVFGGGPIFKERPLLEDVCREVFLGITQKKMSGLIIHGDLIKLLEKEELDWTSGEILRLSSPVTNECHLTIKQDKSLRAFKFIFDGRQSNPFFYKLIEITEIAEDK